MKEAVEMAQGNQSNRNRGRYGQDFSAPPKQGENESRADYNQRRSEEHTSELQSLMRISYAVFCLKKKINIHTPAILCAVYNITNKHYILQTSSTTLCTKRQH